MARFKFTLRVDGDTGIDGDDGTDAREQIVRYAMQNIDVDSVSASELAESDMPVIVFAGDPQSFTDREWLVIGRAVELLAPLADLAAPSRDVFEEAERLDLANIAERAMLNAGPLGDPEPGK